MHLTRRYHESKLLLYTSISPHNDSPGWNPCKPHAEDAYLRFHDMTPAKIIFKVDTCACAKIGYQDARIGYDFAY